MNRLYSISTALVFLALTATSIQAGVIYSNIGIGFPNDTPGPWGVGVTNQPDLAGIPFTAASGGNLASISTDISSTTQPITFLLYGDSSGEPGTLLESWITVVPAFVPSITPVAMTTLESVQNPLLSAGSQYWFLVALPTGSSIHWWSNDQGVRLGFWQGTSISTLQKSLPDNHEVGIQVNSTPEPPSVILFAVGTIAIFTLIRRAQAPGEV